MNLDIYDVARRQPLSPAVLSEGETLTYAELALRCQRAAQRLAARGLLEAKSPLGVVTRRTIATLETLLVCIAHGVPVVCFGSRLPESARDELAARAGVRAIVTPDDEEPASLRDPRLPLIASPAVDPLATLAVIPTSGSTGRSKLVVLSRAAFLAAAQASAINLPLGEGDRWLLCLPLSHVGGLSIVTRSLLAGSAVALFEPPESGLLANIRDLAAAIEREQATLISLVPTLLQALLDADFEPPPSLRAVLLGGAGASQQLVERAAARGITVLTTYGLTEACSQVTTTPLGEAPKLLDGIVSSGRALPGIELAIGSDERIRVRGPTLASALFDESLPLDADGWLVTDDLGQLDPSGELFVRGRASERIVTGGENVDPLTVETCLLRDLRVLAACVFSVPDPRFGEVVACALVVGPGFVPEACRAAVASELAPAALPRRVALLPELALTASGKIDRARTRERAAPALQSWEDLSARSGETPT
jgi:O-succinylbenzoic acid--CoA ligase